MSLEAQGMSGTSVETSFRSQIRGGEVHFMGVAGAGMVALAEAVARAGGRVSGCDLNPQAVRAHLEGLGVEVHGGHHVHHIDGLAALIISAAVPSDHPEVEAARTRGVPILKRAQALGGWVNHGTVVGVAGTHGKTTTTALTTCVLEAAGQDPSAFVGGQVAGWGGNYRAGRDDLFVVEADEYDRSFLSLSPHVAVVTNLEADHLDQYKNLAGVREAFRSFVERIPPQGTLVVCADDNEASRLVTAVEPDRQVVTYGTSAGAMLRAVGVKMVGGRCRFRIMSLGESRGDVELAFSGLHNVRNALAAVAVGEALGAGWAEIRAGLAAFQGVARRFQRLGEAADVTVIDDYAHHPTEVRATLEAARQSYPGRRLVAVFQPHLYSRTRDFARAFGEALTGADVVWVTEIYPAREAPIPGVSGQQIAGEVEDAGGGDVHFHPDLADLPRALARQAKPGDVVLTLGAGSITSVGPELLRLLEGGVA
ncbi:MAG: UDP-N-acetylmuramate--L-alanine ligase [Gemmatimonadota bacterium]